MAVRDVLEVDVEEDEPLFDCVPVAEGVHDSTAECVDVSVSLEEPDGVVIPEED
jgi:hypothetical protein